MLNTVQWTGRSVQLLDQTLLPNTVRYVEITTPERMAQAIRTMEVRGAAHRLLRPGRAPDLCAAKDQYGVVTL